MGRRLAIGARRGAAELAAVLDGDLVTAPTPGATVRDAGACAAPDTVRLATLATALSAAGAATAAPLPAALVAGRQAIVATAAGHLSGTAAGSAAAHTALLHTLGTKAAATKVVTTAPAWIHLATGTMAVAVGVAGLAVGASRALPGDALYGVKRGAEAVRADLAGMVGGQPALGRAHLSTARTRTGELQTLLRDHQGTVTAGELATVVQSWSTEVQAGTQLLDQTAAGQQQLSAFANKQERDLAALVPLVPSRLSAAAGALVGPALGLLAPLTPPAAVGTLTPDGGLLPRGPQPPLPTTTPLHVPAVVPPAAVPLATPTSTGGAAPAPTQVLPDATVGPVTTPAPRTTSATTAAPPRHAPSPPSVLPTAAAPVLPSVLPVTIPAVPDGLLSPLPVALPPGFPLASLAPALGHP